MTCYLVRHGKDDESVRGGWSDSPLCDEGIAQVMELADQIVQHDDLNFGVIFASDLVRTIQTAKILQEMLKVPVEFSPQFREVNNGCLAGMKNDIATKLYPGLYWSTLDWEERYPDGESPKEFYDRISSAWIDFKKQIQELSNDVMLVTHGGVINVIRCLEEGKKYSNKENIFPSGYASITPIEI